MPSKFEHPLLMERRAYELAASGDHIDHLTIEPVLLAEGFPEAQEWLSRDSVRSDIKALCDVARRKKGSS